MQRKEYCVIRDVPGRRWFDSAERASQQTDRLLAENPTIATFLIVRVVGVIQRSDKIAEWKQRHWIKLNSGQKGT